MSIKSNIAKYTENNDCLITKSMKKERHQGLTKLSQNIAYNILSNNLNVNFLFIPSHSRLDANVKAVISKMKRKILMKNEKLESKITESKVYSILVGNAAIDLFSREYLLKYKDDIIKELQANQSKYEFNIKREFPIVWAPSNQYNTLDNNEYNNFQNILSSISFSYTTKKNQLLLK